MKNVMSRENRRFSVCEECYVSEKPILLGLRRVCYNRRITAEKSSEKHQMGGEYNR